MKLLFVLTPPLGSPINITITDSPQANVIIQRNSSGNTINTTYSGENRKTLLEEVEYI